MYSAGKAALAALAVSVAGKAVEAQYGSSVGCIGEANFMCPSLPGTLISYPLEPMTASGEMFCTFSRSYCLDSPEEIPLSVGFGGVNTSTMYLGKSSSLNFTTSAASDYLSVFNGEPTDGTCQTTVAINCDGGVWNYPQPVAAEESTWLLDGAPVVTSVNLTGALMSCSVERTPCVGGNQTDPILFSVQSAFYTAAPGALEPGQILQVFEGEKTGFTMADKNPNPFTPAFFTFATSDIPSSKKECSSAALLKCSTLLAP